MRFIFLYNRDYLLSQCNRRNVLKAFPLKVVAFSLLLAGSSAYSQTLEQAVSATLETNPELKQVFNEFKSRVYESEASSGRYLPSIDLDAGIGFEGIDPAESNSKESTEMLRKDATISLTQLIWDGSNTLNDMDRTAAEAEAQRYQVLADASDKALEVSRVYLDTVQAFEVLQLSEDNLAIHKSIFSDIQRRAESGIGSTADVTQAEARVAKAQANLLAAQNQLFDAQTQFKRMVGDIPQDLIFPNADQNYIPASSEAALSQAFERHPTLRVAQVDVDAARFQYEQSKSGYFPTLSVEASHSWYDDAGGYEGESTETLAMLRLRYNLFNGGSDKANSESAAYKLNQAKDLRENTFRQVEEGLNLSWSALDLSMQQKSFLSDHVDAVSKTVIAYQKQYRIGQRTLLDLLNSQNELFEARKDYLDTKYTEQYAKYRVLNAAGSLLDALRVDIPEEWNDEVKY
jgi:adhesin transport system outer membrane protein